MVYKIIQEIKATRSRNEKESIVAREVDNIELKMFFRLALSPHIHFYQKKKFTQTDTGCGSLLVAMEFIESIISRRKVTGNNAIDSINMTINTISEDDAKVIMHILQKESGCDIGGATINKIWPNLIPEYPSLLATAYTEKLAEKLNWKRGVISQTKSDGGRIAIEVTVDGVVSVFSRAGNELNVFGMFDFLGENFKGFVIDGELLSVEADGKFASRQKSNGIFTKCVRGTLSAEESMALHVTCWDVVPMADFRAGYSPLEYSFRLAKLNEKLVDVNSRHITVVPGRLVHSISQAQDHYDELIAAGEEGSMLKDQDMPWEDKRSKKQLKCKATETGDMEVTGYKDGVGKLTGNLGSLDIKSSDSKVNASMSGFSLKLRSEIYANLTGNPVQYNMIVDGLSVPSIAMPGDCELEIGSIVEVMYNQKVKSRDSDVWSIFLPRFKQIRFDKTIANSFDELK